MLGKFALSLSFAFAFLRGQSIRINAASQYDVPVPQYDLPQEVLEAGEGLIKPMSAALPHFGKQIPQAKRDKWIVKCDSEQTNNECSKAVDGSRGTFWQTKVDTTGTQKPDPLPHTITIDLRVVENVNAISMTPRSDADRGGAVAGHKVYLSLDNQTWGDPVAFGTWFEDGQDKFAIFEPQQAQFVRLQATSATNATQFISIVDLGVWATDSFTPPPRGLGRWGPTIDFPLVPVGVFVDPIFGKVISFSSFQHDNFGQSGTDGTTLTATWDRTTGTVSQRRVRKTDHDMFCPGMSFDANGRMVITGGENAERTSIYDPTSDDWISAPDMKIARGYQGSTTCADGRIFVIGGSWGPDGRSRGNRNGEIYDPKTDNWTLLDGCPAKPIQTTEDWEGEYRSDNHVWLLGWKNNSVFHAGPSKDMHWITTTGRGAIQNAGQRGAGSLIDHDAMCGVAAMYNAAEGKILTAGGAPQYKYKDNDIVKGKKATNNAFIITLDKVNTTVDVKIAGRGMNFQRVFHHAVILPNSETFVVGGQVEGQGFTDDTPQLVPEIYSPIKNSWTPVAAHSIVRVYHSFGLLLPDATVLVGGGGLCSCNVNHFDAQIYTPQYLLTPNGDRAKRPVITKTSAATVRPGASLTVSTDTDVVGASLIRYGGATHSLNNDQRRIELKLQKSGTAFQYGVSIPSDGGVAIPGYWMLFVINALGVPSEAKNVQIQVA